MKIRMVFGVILIMAGIVWGLHSVGMIPGFPGGVFAVNKSKVDIRKETAAADFQNIVVNTSSTNVHLIKGSSNQIVASLEGNASSNYEGKIDLRMEARGDTLKVEPDIPDNFNIGFNMLDIDLTVEIPEKQWSSIKVATSSGNIDVKQINGGAVELKASSGDVGASRVQAKSFAASVKSGNIDVKDVESAAISLESTSGNIAASRFKGNEAAFHAGSGNVKLSEGQAAIKAETSSGDIRLEASSLLKNTELKAGSGNVIVNLDQDPLSLSVDYRGNSGSGTIEWSGFRYAEKDEDKRVIKGTFGSGDIQLKVRTQSGNFTLGKG
ncbi:DUF4097 family beta strand repeat-containing protein [Paenibacillus hamazuiensis]|uniref:DUF4097 family beta strand repeat-containing protein n=1 Tax=Paenibacillus hamazuiensis TaxID=2936508 RepID=UPI00200CCA89|nr:DUF4097 family beta strand repeat-containing protein [Paenibacillus hamazuiensis]